MSIRVKTKRLPKKGVGSDADDRVHASSGNVFADLRLPRADQRLAKAELARQIGGLIKAAGLSQKQAAARLGVDQPKISALLRGQLRQFSTERLMRFLLALDRDVIIMIRDAADMGRPSVRVLVEA